MILEDPAAAPSKPGLALRLFLQLQRKLHFLFEPLRATHVSVMATADREHTLPPYELQAKICERITSRPESAASATPREDFVSVDLVLSAGGTGKTSSSLLIQEKLLALEDHSHSSAGGAIACLFLSLPLAFKHSSEVLGALASFFKESMAVEDADWKCAEPRCVVVICDSWDEVQPETRKAVIESGGIVGLLRRLLGPALRHVVVTSRPEAVVPSSAAVLGLKSTAAVSEHFVVPFTGENFSELVRRWMTRSAFEVEDFSEAKLKGRHAMRPRPRK